MKELKAGDAGVVKNLEVDNYKNIKPDGIMSVNDAKEFWNNEFNIMSGSPNEAEFGGKYNTYQERLNRTMQDNTVYGKYEGERGESKFVPSEETEGGKACKDKLAEYGKDGIEYKNAEPDFSECSEATVKINNMTENRFDYVDSDGNLQAGNFSQADRKCAEQWNSQEKDGKNDWTARDIADYRYENKLTWHERCDTYSMDLVPREIHSYIKHLGGVSECKVRDAVSDIGGEFDE